MMTNNQHVLDFVDKYTKLFQPDNVVWIDSSKQQYKELVSEGIATGELIKLNSKLLPGCLYHRTRPDDVARVENRTFICSREEINAGPTNNWMDPKEAYKKLDALADGAMKGRTMYVIPFSMGKIGSPFAKYGIDWYLCGHDHSREITRHKGVTYITVDALEEHYPNAYYMIAYVGNDLQYRFVPVGKHDDL